MGVLERRHMLLALTAIGVAAAATADGVSTNSFVKKGDVEVDPLMVFLYRTNAPSTARIVLIGGGVIATELGCAFVVAHFHPFTLPFLIAGGLVQIAIHIYEVIHNRSL
jgi:hypothetical protein